MKKQIIILFTTILTLTINAQIDKTTLNVDLSKIAKENVKLTTNTNVLLVGEYLYYKLSLFSQDKPSNISKIAYLELISEDENSKAKHTLTINNSSAHGRLFIPTQLETGHYKLIAYTNWSKNNNENGFFIKDIFIINAFTSKNELDNSVNTVSIKKNNSLKITELNPSAIIKLNKKTFNNREAVKINISTNEKYQNGDYYLSIKKLDSLLIQNSPSERESTLLNDTNKLFIPEMRGQLIIGQLLNNNNTSDIQNRKVGLSITGKNDVFKIATTNASGVFYFSLENNFNNNNITLQVIGDEKDNYNIKLLNDVPLNYEKLQFKKVSIDKSLKHLIEQWNTQNQIENAYYESKKDSTLAKPKAKPFYNSKEIKYVLDDYTRFSTVRETFIEVLIEAAVRKEGDSYRILVYDRYDEKKNRVITDIDPLVLVDGMIVQNNNDLMNYNPKKIEYISIVKGQYLYGSKLYQGIIDVSTFNQDFKTTVSGSYILETTINTPKNETNYYQPDYTQGKTNKRVPDYRRQLLWLPKVNLENKSSTFKTFTSDDKGIYEIKLEGYTKSGEFISSKNYFEVN